MTEIPLSVFMPILLQFSVLALCFASQPPVLLQDPTEHSPEISLAHTNSEPMERKVSMDVNTLVAKSCPLKLLFWDLQTPFLCQLQSTRAAHSRVVKALLV